jgi:hypothetical protein
MGRPPCLSPLHVQLVTPDVCLGRSQRRRRAEGFALYFDDGARKGLTSLSKSTRAATLYIFTVIGLSPRFVSSSPAHLQPDCTRANFMVKINFNATEGHYKKLK